MGSLLFVLAFWGVGAALDLPTLWREKRKKELCVYLAFSLLGVGIMAMYIFLSDIPSIFSLLGGANR